MSYLKEDVRADFKKLPFPLAVRFVTLFTWKSEFFFRLARCGTPRKCITPFQHLLQDGKHKISQSGTTLSSTAVGVRILHCFPYAFLLSTLSAARR